MTTARWRLLQHSRFYFLSLEPWMWFISSRSLMCVFRAGCSTKGPAIPTTWDTDINLYWNNDIGPNPGLACMPCFCICCVKFLLFSFAFSLPWWLFFWLGGWLIRWCPMFFLEQFFLAAESERGFVQFSVFNNENAVNAICPVKYNGCKTEFACHYMFQSLMLIVSSVSI